MLKSVYFKLGNSLTTILGRLSIKKSLLESALILDDFE